MSEATQIKLKTTSILNVPLQLYDEFTFFVNGEEFKTTQLISELLSPKIGRMKLADPTFDKITINTTNKGDFSTILKLANFEQSSILESELAFIKEIIEILENESIEIEGKFTEITENNAIEYVKNYKQYKQFYSKPLSDVVDFISSNFSDFIEKHFDELEKLDVEDLDRIINNPHLVLKNEDQLISLINHLYLCDSEYSELYKCVLFQFVHINSMNLFLNIFNFNDMTSEGWKAISCRLKHEVKKINENEIMNFKDRYTNMFVNHEILTIMIF